MWTASSLSAISISGTMQITDDEGWSAFLDAFKAADIGEWAGDLVEAAMALDASRV